MASFTRVQILGVLGWMVVVVVVVVEVVVVEVVVVVVVEKFQFSSLTKGRSEKAQNSKLKLIRII